MEIKREVIAEDEEKRIEQVTYRRDNTRLKVYNVEEVLREVAYIYRHSIHPIKELLIKEGQDIQYTQQVVIKKEKNV